MPGNKAGCFVNNTAAVLVRS